MNDITEQRLEPVARMTRDLRAAAATLSDHEARFLVDSYYMMQDNRIRSGHQLRQLGESGEPNSVLSFLEDQSSTIEGQIKSALDRYSAAHPVGQWMRAQKGIGPVIAAGLLAHIDITKAPTVGHIWRFAGLDPTARWLGTDGAAKHIAAVLGALAAGTNLTYDQVVRVCLAPDCARNPANIVAMMRNAKGRGAEDVADDESEDGDGTPRAETFTVRMLASALAKRPWNATLKTLCWKIGESFVKVSGADDAYYGVIYRERKALETQRNDAGAFAEQAAAMLGSRKIGKDTDAFKAYITGRLPPAHVHARAKRYAVKLFLAHMHEVWYRHHFKVDPLLPYPIAILGHAHRIPAP